ncbi:Gfo/Idh/MocA family protein [Pseudoalteromonas maricaloris]|uniref:Gfo/Idh/MocA family protein n=1 Tax=Pseudoalteromonas maricaloris TaxID=184924 RepID=UPI00029ADE71|nr:Gfo/Idh/MocA family oxidoreductase [Pseudoalteromonas flavipulchra]
MSSEFKTIRVAVVGIGNWGKAIVKTLRNEVSDVQLSHVVTSNSEVAPLLPEQTKILASRDELVAHCDEFDCVVAALPPHLNLPLAQLLLPLGIPLFMEKPLALSAQDAHAILSLATRHQSIVQINHIDLYNPAVVEIAARLNSPITVISGKIGAAYPRRAIMRPLWEYSPHFIAASLKLIASQPISISACYDNLAPELQDQEHRELVTVTIRFENGAQAKIQAGNGMNNKTRTLTVSTASQQFEFVDRDAVPLRENNKEIVVDLTLPLAKSLAHFVNKVRTGDTSLTDFSEGVRVIEILEAADRALDEQREVKL